MSDLEAYITQQKSILEELSQLESKDFETKSEYIVRLKEVTRPLVEQGYYEGIKLNDLASFIMKTLLPKYHITFNSSGDYYSLFEDEEKHSEKNPMSSRSREEISSPLTIRKQTGSKILDELKRYAETGSSMPENYKYHLYFERIIDISNEAHKQAESIIYKMARAHHFITKWENTKIVESELTSTEKKELEGLKSYYESCKNILKIVEEEKANIDAELIKLNDFLAQLKHTSKSLDDRSKITFLEKWNIIIANIELGISAIAKRMLINKKHITNNIRPTHNPVTGKENNHHNYIDWFRHIQVVSPSGERFTFDAKDYFDKQIERGELNLSIEPMILKNADLVE